MVDSSWYDLDDCKSELDIASADTVDDSLLDDYGAKVNRKIDNKIFPYKDDIPETSDITEDLKGAAVLYVAYSYKRKIKEFEAATKYKEDFDETIEDVIVRLRATPESRSQRKVYSKGYATSPLRDE